MPKGNQNGDDDSNHRRGKSMEGVTVSRIGMNSPDGERILKAMRKTNFDEKFLDRYWRVDQIDLVANERLERQYDTLKNELRTLGRKTEDLEDTFVFSAETEKACKEICREGHKVGLKKRHVLGYTGSGVHVVRNFDILSRYIAYQQISSPAHIVIFKAFLGKAKPIVPRLHKEDNYVSAWSGFDCHISARKIEPTMTICEALNCSYVYFYEYDDISSNTVKHPRQLLPHAVIHLVRKYTIGAETPFLAVGRHDRYSNVEVQGETRRGFRFTYPKPNRKQSQLVSRQRKTKEFMKSSLQSQLLEMRTKGDSRPLSVLPNGLSDSEVANKTIVGKTTTDKRECDSTIIRFNGIKYCVSPTRKTPNLKKPDVNGDVRASFTTFENQSDKMTINRDVHKLPLSMKPFVRLKRLKKDTILRLSRKHKRPKTTISSQELGLKTAKDTTETGCIVSDRNQEQTKSKTHNENSSDNSIVSDSVNKEDAPIDNVTLVKERQIEPIDKSDGSANAKCQVTSGNDSEVTVTPNESTDTERNSNKPKDFLGSLTERKTHNIDTIDLLAKVKEIQCSAKKKCEEPDKDSGKKHERTFEERQVDRVTQKRGQSAHELVKENLLEDPIKKKASPKADLSNTKVLASTLNITGKHEDDKFSNTASKSAYSSDILHQRIQACKDMAKSSSKHLSTNKSAQGAKLNKPQQSQNRPNVATNHKGNAVSKPNEPTSIHEKYSWTIAELEKFNVLQRPDYKKVKSTVKAHTKGIDVKDTDLVENETVQSPRNPTEIDVKHMEKVNSSKDTFNYAQAKHNSVVKSAPKNAENSQSIHTRVQGAVQNQSSQLHSDLSLSKTKQKTKQIDETSSYDHKLVSPTCNTVQSPPRKIRKDKVSGSTNDKVEESHRSDCVPKPTTIKDLFKEPLHRKLADKIRAKQILNDSAQLPNKFGTSIPRIEGKTAVSPPAGVIAPEQLDRSPKVASANMTGSKMLTSQPASTPSNPFDAAYTSLSTQYIHHPSIPPEIDKSHFGRHEKAMHPYKDPRSLSNITPYSLDHSSDSRYNGTVHSYNIPSITKSQTDKSVNVNRSHVSCGAKGHALQTNHGAFNQNAPYPRSELNGNTAHCLKPARFQNLPDPVIELQKEMEAYTEIRKTAIRRSPNKFDSNVKEIQKSDSYKKRTIINGSIDQNMGAWRKGHAKDNVNNSTKHFPTREMVASCFSEKPRHNIRDPRLMGRRGADQKSEVESKSIGTAVSTSDPKLSNSGEINVAEENKALSLSKDTHGVSVLGSTYSSEVDKVSPPKNRPNFTIDANTAQKLQRVLRKHISEVQKNAALTGQPLPSSFETKSHERSKKTPCQDNVGVPRANKKPQNSQISDNNADSGSQKSIKTDAGNGTNDKSASQAAIDTGRIEAVKVKSKETSQANPSRASVVFPLTSTVELDGLKHTSKTDLGSQDNTKTEIKVMQDKTVTNKTANPNGTVNTMTIQKNSNSSDSTTLIGCNDREVSIERSDNDSQDTVIGGIEQSPPRLQCLSEGLQSILNEHNTDKDEIKAIDVITPFDYQTENGKSYSVMNTPALIDRDYKKENPSDKFTPLSENDSQICALPDRHNISATQVSTKPTTSSDCSELDIMVNRNCQSFEKRAEKSYSHLLMETSFDEIAIGKYKDFSPNADEHNLSTINDFEKEDGRIGDHIDIKNESIPCVSTSSTKELSHPESPMMTEFKVELNDENTDTSQESCYTPMVQTVEQPYNGDTIGIEGKFIGSSWAEVCQNIINKEITATESQDDYDKDKSKLTQHRPSTIFGQIHRLRNGSTIHGQRKSPEVSRSEIIDTLRSLSTALQALSEPNLEREHEQSSDTVDNTDNSKPSEIPLIDTKPVVQEEQITNNPGKYSVIQVSPIETHSVNAGSELIPLGQIKKEPETENTDPFLPAKELIDVNKSLENNSTGIAATCNNENRLGIITSIKEEPDVTSYQSLHSLHEETNKDKQILLDASIQTINISDCGSDNDKAMSDTHTDDNVLPVLFDVNNDPCVHPLEPFRSIPTLSKVESEPIRIKCDPETDNTNILPSCNEFETSRENTEQVSPVSIPKPKPSLRESIKHVRALRAKAGMLNKGMNERKNIFDTKVSIQRMRKKLAMPLLKHGKIEVDPVNNVLNNTTVTKNKNHEVKSTKSTMPVSSNEFNQSSENERVTSSVETSNDLNKHESTHAMNHDNVTGNTGNNDPIEENTEGLNETQDANTPTTQSKDKSPNGEGDQMVTSSSTPSQDGPKSQKSNKGKKRDIIPFETVMRKKKEQYLKYKRGLTSQKFINYNEFKHELRRGLVPPAYVKFPNQGSDGRALYNFGMYRPNFFRKNIYHHNKYPTYSPEKLEDFSRSEQRPVISERGTMLFEENRENDDLVTEHGVSTHSESFVERDKAGQEDSFAHRMQSNANIQSHSKEPHVSQPKVADTDHNVKERTRHSRNTPLSQTRPHARHPHPKSNNFPAFEHHRRFSTFSAGTFRKLPFNSGKSGYFSWRKKYQAPVKTVRIGNERMYVTRKGAIQTEEEHMEWKMFKERERIRVQIEQAVKEYRRTFENTGDDFVGDGKVSQYLQTLSEKLEHIQSKRDILTKPYVPKPKPNPKPREDTIVAATDFQPKEEPVEAQRLRSVDMFRDQFERSLNVTKQKRNEDTLVDALWTDPEEKSKQSDMIEKMLREHVFKHFENVAEKLKADLTARLASTSKTIENTGDKSFDKDSDRYSTISKQVEKQLETIRNQTSKKQTEQNWFQRNTPMPQEWNPDRDQSRSGGSTYQRSSTNRHVTSKSRSPEPTNSRLPQNHHYNSRSRSGSNDRYRPRNDLVRNRDPVNQKNKSDFMSESRSRSRSGSPRRPSSREYPKYHDGGWRNDQQANHRYSSTWNSRSRSRSPGRIQRRSRSGSERYSRSRSRSPDERNIYDIESRHNSRSRSRSRDRQYHAISSGSKHDSRQKSPPARRPQNRFVPGPRHYSRQHSRSPDRPHQKSCSESQAVSDNRPRPGTSYHSMSRSPVRIGERSMSPEYREWNTDYTQSKRRYGDNNFIHKRRSRSRSASKDRIPPHKKLRVERSSEATQLGNNRATPNVGCDPKENEIDSRNFAQTNFEKYYKAVVKSKWDDDPINDETLSDKDVMTDTRHGIHKSESSGNGNKSTDPIVIDRDITLDISPGTNGLEIEHGAEHHSVRNPVRHRSSRIDKAPQETDYLSDDSPIDVDRYISREEQDIRKGGGSRDQFSNRDTDQRGWNNNRASHSRGWNQITEFRGRNLFHKTDSRGRGWINRTNDRGRGLYNKTGGRGWYNQTNGRGRSWYNNRESRGRGWYNRTERNGRNDFRFRPADGNENIHHRPASPGRSKHKHHDITGLNRQRNVDDYGDQRNDDYELDDREGMSNASKGSGYRHHDRFSRRDHYEAGSAYDDDIQVIGDREARSCMDHEAFPGDIASSVKGTSSSYLKSTQNPYNKAPINSDSQRKSQSPQPIPTICQR